MGCKSNIVLGGLAVAGIGIGSYAAYTAYMNQPALQVIGQVGAVDLAAVAGVTPSESDTVVKLKHLIEGGNTQLTWHCGKDQAGVRHDFTGTFNRLSGALVYDAESQTLKALEARILLESMVGSGSDHAAPPALTNTVIKQRWFKIDEYPDAVFTASSFKAVHGKSDQALIDEGYTHVADGTLMINGIEKSLELPLKVSFSGESVEIHAGVTFDRTAFEVLQPIAIPATTVDDDVKLDVVVKASPDPTAVMAELGQMLANQEQLIGIQSKQIATLEKTVSMMQDSLSGLSQKVERGLSAAPQVSTADLPQKISVTEPETAMEYELVLIPGDEEAGIAPFYMATTEVTWDQYKTWSFCEDIDDPKQVADLRKADLRPSPPYGDMSQGMGFGRKPAIRMSRLNAQRFAEWLSKQTGVAFRLPTEAEWDYAYVTTQGPLDEIPDNVDDIAWNDDNADFETQDVASKEPNAYGIYDLLGNVYEWVTQSEDGNRVVRGGSYWIFADEINGGLREIEEMDVWNAGYPNEPKSKWWFVDRIDIGIRLVADVTPNVGEFAAE